MLIRYFYQIGRGCNITLPKQSLNDYTKCICRTITTNDNGPEQTCFLCIEKPAFSKHTHTQTQIICIFKHTTHTHTQPIQFTQCTSYLKPPQRTAMIIINNLQMCVMRSRCESVQRWRCAMCIIDKQMIGETIAGGVKHIFAFPRFAMRFVMNPFLRKLQVGTGRRRRRTYRSAPAEQPHKKRKNPLWPHHTQIDTHIIIIHITHEFPSIIDNRVTQTKHFSVREMPQTHLIYRYVYRASRTVRCFLVGI